MHLVHKFPACWTNPRRTAYFYFPSGLHDTDEKITIIGSKYRAVPVLAAHNATIPFSLFAKNVNQLYGSHQWTVRCNRRIPIKWRGPLLLLIDSRNPTSPQLSVWLQFSRTLAHGQTSLHYPPKIKHGTLFPFRLLLVSTAQMLTELRFWNI